MKFKKYSTAADTYTTLPATFQTSGADVVNYQVYGTASGVGEETENIAPTFSDAILGDEITFTVLSGNSVKINGSDASNRFYGTQMRLAEGTYSMKSFIPFAGGVDSIRVDIRKSTPNGAVISDAVDNGNGVTFTVDSTVARQTLYFVIRVAADYVCDNMILKPTLVTGSTIPTSFIPIGYKIPILNTSGVTENILDCSTFSAGHIDGEGNIDSPEDVSSLSTTSSSTSNYDLFIGDSKLGEDEYVDFSEQKVYKRTANLFDKDNLNNIITGYIDSSGTIVDSIYNTCLICPVEPNTQYTVYSDIASTNNARIAEYSSSPVADSSGTIVKTFAENEIYLATFTTSNNASYIAFHFGAPINNYRTQEFISKAMVVEGSTAPESYDPYLQPIDPPAPFPTLTTYLGENSIDIDTTVQPEKVVLTVAAWREIEAKKYANGSWTDIVVRRYENGAWVPSPIPENNIANLQGLLTLLEDHWLPGVNDYRSMILVRTNRNDDTANQLCYMLTCYSTNPSPHFESEFLNNRYWLNDYSVPYNSTDFYLRKFSWSQGGGWVYDGDEDNKRDDYFVPIDSNTYNVYLLRIGSSTQYDNNAGYQYFYDLSAYF